MQDDIVDIARGWLGTPYRHQASLRGAGCDCLGLLRGVWRARYGAEPEPVPAYTPDWSEPEGAERLLVAAARHLRPVRLAEAVPGDVLLFRMRRGAVAKHLGILASTAAGEASFIHAYSGRGVVESPLGAAWAAKIAATFRFP
ncbi:peptidase [Halovulum dunhuangense]|uniref:Peptidase n=1 Tax=Halovulum dunhuangense TaxID=1505036 RepID=A0A849L663_9RHOB|nr:NlpC/P60 family protein [Halovulum dunhuangense]NNU81915.1 peptidase [Halovulum dunhuangense]